MGVGIGVGPDHAADSSALLALDSVFLVDPGSGFALCRYWCDRQQFYERPRARRCCLLCDMANRLRHSGLIYPHNLQFAKGKIA